MIGLTALGHDFGNLRSALDGTPAHPNVIALLNQLLESAGVLAMAVAIPEALKQEFQLFSVPLKELECVLLLPYLAVVPPCFDG